MSVHLPLAATEEVVPISTTALPAPARVGFLESSAKPISMSASRLPAKMAVLAMISSTDSPVLVLVVTRALCVKPRLMNVPPIPARTAVLAPTC